MTTKDDEQIRTNAKRLLAQEQEAMRLADEKNPVLPSINADAAGAARIVLERFFTTDDLPRLVRWRETWYSYFHNMWSERTEEDITHFVHERLLKCRTVDKEGNLKDFNCKSCNVNEIVIQMAQIVGIPSHMTVPLMRVDGGWIPHSTKGKIVCKGQIVDMLEKRVTSSSYIFIPNGATWVWVDKAKKPTAWFKFLESILGDRQDEIKLLQEWMGYVLSGDTWAQKGLIILGPPRAGKGVIGHIMTHLLGRSMVASPTLSSMSKDFGLQQLLDKRLCLLSDARLSSRADIMAVVEILLRLVADDAIDVNRKHKSAITTQVGARVMMLSNEMPQLYDSSNAINKRFLVIPLTKSFLGKEDPGLLDRLLPELPAIAHWAADGYIALRKRGRFAEPDSSSAATDEWYNETNQAMAFFDDVCSPSPDDRVLSNDLYAAYRSWCEAGGQKPLDARWMIRKLTAGKSFLRSVKSDGKRYVIGLKMVAATF